MTLKLYNVVNISKSIFIKKKKATRNKVQGLNDLSLTKSKIDNMLDYESKKKKKYHSK